MSCQRGALLGAADGADGTAAFLERLALEPEAVERGRIVPRNCACHPVGVQFPELVCGMKQRLDACLSDWDGRRGGHSGTGPARGRLLRRSAHRRTAWRRLRS